MKTIKTNAARKNSKTTKTIGQRAKEIQAKMTKAPRTPKARLSYTGAPVQATRLYTRTMPEFKNTEANVLMAVNDDAGTVTYLNTYRGGELSAAYDARIYTYPLSEKKVEAKAKEMIELEVTEWPPYVVQATKTKRPKKLVASK